MAASPDVIDRVMAWTKVDFAPAHRQPQWWRVALATVLAIGLSLAADAALVAIGDARVPRDQGLRALPVLRLRQADGRGRLIGCAAWPIVTRISSAPRWLFFRLAILVTLVLWLPDVWIWHKGAAGARRGGADGDASRDRADHVQPVGARGAGAAGGRRRGAGARRSEAAAS